MKNKKRKYRNKPTKLNNWYYDRIKNYYLDYQGVQSSTSIRHDHYGFSRQFKVYEAEEFQLKHPAVA